MPHPRPYFQLRSPPRRQAQEASRRSAAGRLIRSVQGTRLSLAEDRRGGAVGTRVLDAAPQPHQVVRGQGRPDHGAVDIVVEAAQRGGVVPRGGGAAAGLPEVLGGQSEGRGTAAALRIICVVGTGNTARRTLGMRPTTAARLENLTVALQDLCAGRSTKYVTLRPRRPPRPGWVPGSPTPSRCVSRPVPRPSANRGSSGCCPPTGRSRTFLTRSRPPAITDLPSTQASSQRLGELARSHWGIQTRSSRGSRSEGVRDRHREGATALPFRPFVTSHVRRVCTTSLQQPVIALRRPLEHVQHQRNARVPRLGEPLPRDWFTSGGVHRESSGRPRRADA